ncbi:MAG: GHKL domain-containing protein [Polyangiaceae bacterium]|nr:GHKL domain-containing protein [Polyangiaceae bacterium]
MQRKGVTHEHLAGLVDCMLVASSRISPEATAEQAASELISAVADRLLDTAVGAHLPRGDKSPVTLVRSPRRQVSFEETLGSVLELSPCKSERAAEERARLFPEYVHERVTPLDDGEGSTLHLASDDEKQLDDLEVLVSRLSLVLGSAVRRARTFTRAAAQAAELRRARAQLIQSDKLASLGKIAASIVHELNNPLTSILAYSDYLHKKHTKIGSDPMDIERLARIQESASRILSFTRDLIDYTRPSSELRGAVEIHRVIERALVFCEHELEQLGITVDKSFDDVPNVHGVAGQLTQVFVNLFTNAAHAMRDRGGRLHIVLAAADDGSEVTITVSDDGHGIEAEHLELIFEPFFTTKPEGGGTGLGLSIVREIVARHGGRILVESGASKGTVFTIALPALPRDEG